MSIKQLKYTCCFLFLVFFIGCKPGPVILLDGDIKAAKVEDKTEYYAPLVLEQGNVEKLVLNGVETEFSQGIVELADAGFYEMVLDDTDTVLFVLLKDDRVYDNRVYAEWGLKDWYPEDPVLSEKVEGEVDLICPQNYVPGIAFPFLLKVQNWSPFNNDYVMCHVGNEKSFKMKRGIASSSVVLNTNEFDVLAGTLTFTAALTEIVSEAIILNGNIESDYAVPANSLVLINEDVVITTTGSLTVAEGVVVLVDEGKNIYNYGPVAINGTSENPVLFTCSDPEKYFGGFIANGSAAEVNASHAFFSRFSHNVGGDFSYGHAQHQALFKSSRADLTFTNCYFFDSPGQVIHPEGAKVALEGCIVQRTKTTGQFNRGSATINNSYFSDFPDDSRNYQDNDNDGLYLNDIDVEITNSAFMYTKDDGIDSGGDKGGVVSISNCVFEACFHEGLALSSVDPAEKLHTITSCFITRCQQGTELGFSSPNHAVVIDDCTFSENYIGVRFGDCYTRPVDGTIEVKNSSFINNGRDTWNMVRLIWEPKAENLTIVNSTFN